MKEEEVSLNDSLLVMRLTGVVVLLLLLGPNQSSTTLTSLTSLLREVREFRRRAWKGLGLGGEAQR